MRAILAIVVVALLAGCVTPPPSPGGRGAPYRNMRDVERDHRRKGELYRRDSVRPVSEDFNRMKRR